MYAEFAKIYCKDKSSIHEIVKKENKICASLAATPQIANAKGGPSLTAWYADQA